ncbi:25S rRNA (adenine(645)-N(1))-methyltransferase [Yarrowia sp. C11]|nr:25S rRNA (adenine(645)-N(1))-methyltransferase [Yarrowia sp. C11]KAG5364391.1 25S rRNA (adenine(645)-N(1))-methyltransferase [Yarrowia sp. E02]
MSFMFQVEGWNLSSDVKADKLTKRQKEKRDQQAERGVMMREKREQREKERAEDEKAAEADAKAKAKAADKAAAEKAASDKADKASEDTSKKSKKDKKKDKKDKKNKDKTADESKPAAAPVEAFTQAPAAKLTPLQLKMKEKLAGSRFRWINEQLYTVPSDEALKMIQDNPEIFDEYHAGFRNQVQGWPENPVDTFVKRFSERLNKPVCSPGGLPAHKRENKIVVADMGCGEAQLALDLSKINFKKKGVNPQNKNLTVETQSFDLKKANERVTVADVKNVPMEDNSADIVVFCLALMGTNFLDFIKEAMRILRPNGELWIAEIKSRFTDGQTDEFIKVLKSLNFFHKLTDDENSHFVRFEFFKPTQEILAQRKKKVPKRKFIDYGDEEEKKTPEDGGEQLEKRRKKQAEGEWLLKPCIYKRR